MHHRNYIQAMKKYQKKTHTPQALPNANRITQILLVEILESDVMTHGQE
jgi:hypothetical protein